MPTKPKSDIWWQLFRELASALNCLPSSFPDGNGHVLQKARELVAAREPQPEDVCPWPDYFGQRIVHGARMWHPLSGQTFTAVRMLGVERHSDAWLAVYDQPEVNAPSRLVLHIGEKGQVVLMGCGKAPPGWRCSRNAGHDGPCAAHEWPKAGKEAPHAPHP